LAGGSRQEAVGQDALGWNARGPVFIFFHTFDSVVKGQ